jgi:YHS domain-containing protein
MASVGQFEERIRERLPDTERTRGERVRRCADVMAGQETSHQRFQAFAEPFHTRVLQPRLASLARRFPDSSVGHFRTTTGFLSVCRFARTDRFPASTMLALGLDLDVARQMATVRYHLEIIPILMSTHATDHLDLPLDGLDEALIDEWIERHLLRFVDTYLRVESDPHYQHDTLKLDPVCGTQIDRVDVAYRCQFASRSYFFCSDACRRAFLATPALFLSGRLPWVGT